jgi:hypothetical protein
MPRKIRTLNGLLTNLPTPVETSPAARVLKNYRNETYLVFTDESFRSFFGLENRNGYFCYAAVGIPEREYESFKRRLVPIFKEYESYVVGDSGNQLREFKFEDFGKLPRDQREAIATKIGRMLPLHGGFIAGFYARVVGIVTEKVRVDLLFDDHAASLPETYTEQYEAARSELQEQLEGVGQSETIAMILRTVLSCIAQFLETSECKFRFICDPKEKKEDKAVHTAVDDYFKLLKNAIPNAAKLYLGLDNTRHSHEEVGVQIADLMVGEIRSLFQAHPELLTEGASKVFITGTSREEFEWWGKSFEDGPFGKIGGLTKISPDLRRALTRTDGTNCIPLYRNSCAAGLLTCYTDLGQPRHIEIFEGHFFQQTD